MIAKVSAHRRANAFAQVLEERSAQGTAAERPGEPGGPAEGTERSRMLAVASSLADLPRPELDSDVKAVQRARLVAAMETMVRDGTAPGEATGTAVPEQRSPKKKSRQGGPLRGLRPRSRLTKGLAAGGLTVGVAASAFGGIAVASSDALPGDSLYALKRGMEDVKLGLADGDSDRGSIYLDQASTRLNEARRLMERGRSGPLDHESVSEIRRALSGMRHDASEGHRLLVAAYRHDGSLAPIQALSSFSQSHRDSWTVLRDALPTQLTDVRDQVTDVFDAIDHEVAPLRPLLPPTPTQGTGSQGPAGGQGSGDPSRTGDPAPSASGGSGARGHGRADDPKPSTSDSGPTGGLLGGATGGLLDPPLGDPNPPSPSTKGGRSATPEPDITVPPLLPGVLNLRLDGQPNNGGQ